MDTRKMTEAQRAYEAKRAAKHGMTLEKWLAAKDKRARAEAAAEARALAAAAPAKEKRPGLLSRLLGRRRKAG